MTYRSTTTSPHPDLKLKDIKALKVPDNGPSLDIPFKKVEVEP